MTLDSSEHLRDCAKHLDRVLNARDLNHPMLSETATRLKPLIDESLGQQKNLPPRVPRFVVFGANLAHHPKDVELEHSIEAFERAMGAISSKPWPFMQSFDLYQPFDGDWASWSPKENA